MTEEEKLQDAPSELSEEPIGEGAEPAEEPTEEAKQTVSLSDRKAAAVRYNRKPLWVAAGVLAASVGIFGCWKMFFDTSLKGTWHLHYQQTASSSPVDVYITLEDDHRLRLHNGGVTLLGHYYVGKDSSDPTFLISVTNLGRPYLTGNFGFRFEGNHLTGRTLLLCDKDGLFLPNEPEDSDTEKYLSEHYDRVSSEGTYQYIIPCTAAKEEYHTEAIENAKYLDELYGSWLYDDGPYGNSFTYTFTKDGELILLSEEYEIKGTYSVSDKEISARIYSIGDTKPEDDSPMDYTLSGDKLVIGTQEMVRVDDPYAFRNVSEASS